MHGLALSSNLDTNEEASSFLTKVHRIYLDVICGWVAGPGQPIVRGLVIEPPYSETALAFINRFCSSDRIHNDAKWYGGHVYNTVCGTEVNHFASLK